MTQEQEQSNTDNEIAAMEQEESGRGSAPPPYSPPAYVNPSTAQPRPRAVVPPKIFGPNPMGVKCANCQEQVTTSLVHAFGSCTIIASVTLFILFFPCFWVPLVLDVCKDVHHMCPSCNSLLGTYKVI